MKKIFVGINKATMVNDGGEVFTAVKQGNYWLFEGMVYDNPFKAFKGIETEIKN